MGIFTIFVCWNLVPNLLFSQLLPPKGLWAAPNKTAPSVQRLLPAPWNVSSLSSSSPNLPEQDWGRHNGGGYTRKGVGGRSTAPTYILALTDLVSWMPPSERAGQNWARPPLPLSSPPEHTLHHQSHTSFRRPGCPSDRPPPTLRWSPCAAVTTREEISSYAGSALQAAKRFQSRTLSWEGEESTSGYNPTRWGSSCTQEQQTLTGHGSGSLPLGCQPQGSTEAAAHLPQVSRQAGAQKQPWNSPSGWYTVS